MEWTERLIAWMDKTGRDPDRLAVELSVSPRSVHRWRWGDEIPDDVAQTKLMVMGAPTPLRSAKPKPPAPTKLELKLEELHASLREAAEQIGRIAVASAAPAPAEERPAGSAEILAALRRIEDQLARVEAVLDTPRPPEAASSGLEEALAPLRLLDERLLPLEDISTSLRVLGERVARIEKELL